MPPVFLRSDGSRARISPIRHKEGMGVSSRCRSSLMRRIIWARAAVESVSAITRAQLAGVFHDPDAGHALPEEDDAQSHAPPEQRHHQRRKLVWLAGTGGDKGQATVAVFGLRVKKAEESPTQDVHPKKAFRRDVVLAHPQFLHAGQRRGDERQARRLNGGVHKRVIQNAGGGRGIQRGEGLHERLHQLARVARGNGSHPGGLAALVRRADQRA